MDRAPVALAVDDAPDIRLLLLRALGSVGYEVVGAGSGSEGVARAGGVRPDVVILDVQMPEMDGWETLARLRDHVDPVVAAVPVIMCSVKSSAADRARGWALGCDAYVTKPFALKDLVDAIDEVRARSVAERDDHRRRQLAAALAELAEAS